MGTRITRPIVDDPSPSPKPIHPLLSSLPSPSPLPPSPSPTNNRSQSGLEAGAVIGRKWLLLDRVGRGAFGDIFVAECVAKGDALCGRRVALKVERLELADEATVKAALEAEARQKERDRQLAVKEGRAVTEGSNSQPLAPSSPSPLTPSASPSPLALTVGLPLPSEPLSPQSPYPMPSPSPAPSDAPSSPMLATTGRASAPVYMKRCIVKLEAVVLTKLQVHSSFPRFVEYGRDGPQQVAYLAMQLLGDNLLRLRRAQRKLRFSLPTTLRFGLSALRCLQVMHDCGFIHRDVKPSNFVIGTGADTQRVYMIDFGLARAYREKATGAVIPARKEIGGFRGTPRYASVFVHREEDLSRRDDLWSLLYILVEFVTGDLPWGAKREKAAIGAIKERYHSPKLLKGCPSCFLPFFHHLASLSFDSTPDYALLSSLLEGKLSKLRVKPDHLMDWEDAGQKAQALTQLAQDALASPSPPPAGGKVEEEKERVGGDDAPRMVIVLHPDPHPVIESRPSLAPKTPPPSSCKGEEEEEGESSLRLQSPMGGVGGSGERGRAVSASSVSMSSSPSWSGGEGGLGSGGGGLGGEEAGSASPVLSVWGERGSVWGEGERGSRGGELDGERGDAGHAGGGELMAMYEQGVSVRQLLRLDGNELNQRRKKKALTARSSDSRSSEGEEGAQPRPLVPDMPASPTVHPAH